MAEFSWLSFQSAVAIVVTGRLFPTLLETSANLIALDRTHLTDRVTSHLLARQRNDLPPIASFRVVLPV